MAPSQVGPDDDGDEKDRSDGPLTPGPGPYDGDADDDTCLRSQVVDDDNRAREHEQRVRHVHANGWW